MAKGPLYRVPFRRRRECKTDYYARRKMLLSKKIRAVVRKTNRYIIVQLIKATPTGDLTLVSATSKELRKYGYDGCLKNIPAAYLTGYLVGIKSNGKIKEAIADFGLYTVTPQSRLFAAIQGLIDAGIKIPVGEEMLVSEERLKGVPIKKYYEMIKDSGKNIFTKSNPDIPSIFEKVKETITTNAPRVGTKAPKKAEKKEVTKKVTVKKVAKKKKAAEEQKPKRITRKRSARTTKKTTSSKTKKVKKKGE